MNYGLLFILWITLLFIPSKIHAQEYDHLVMEMDIQDSVARITAHYQLSESIYDSVYFLLNPEFKIYSVTADGLSSYTMEMKEGRPFPFWLLKFNDSSTSKNVIVKFEYEINLSQQNHMRSNWIELNADKLWQPNTDINNRITYELTILNLPDGYTFISHSDASVEYNDDRIIVKKLNPWYEVLFLAGNDMQKWTFDTDITIIGSNQIPETTVESIGSKVRNSIDLLNESIGKSDPIQDFIVVLRNTNRDEIGYQVNRKNMIITGADFNSYGNLSHEVAHFWWSKANFVKEPWMNESFANYSMYQVMEKYVPSDYQALLEKHKTIADDAIPVSEATSFAENAYPSFYYKGAVLLMELEEKIGRDKMNAILASCIENDIATTQGFLRELARITNQEISNVFAESLKN